MLVGPALAAESFYGRWALTLAGCADDDAAFVVTPLSLRWPDTACAVRTSYRVGAVWHIGVRCVDAATDVPVGLQLKEDDRLAMEWSGARLELRRCP
jgi:hypothetical protein